MVPVPVPIRPSQVVPRWEILKMIFVIFWYFLTEGTHFEARFGILVKFYTILTNDHRNRTKLDPIRGNFSEPVDNQVPEGCGRGLGSEPVANQVPEGCGRGVGSEPRGHTRLWGRMVG